MSALRWLDRNLLVVPDWIIRRVARALHLTRKGSGS